MRGRRQRWVDTARRGLEAGLLVLLATMMGAASPAAQQPTAGSAPHATQPDAPAKPAAPRSAGRPRADQAAPGNLVGHGGPIKAIAADPGTGRILSGSFDYSLIAWDTAGEAPRIVHRMPQEGAVNAVAFVPGSNQALAAGDDQSVWLWDLATGKVVHRFKGHTGKINALVVSADGRFAVSSSWDRTARVWDLAHRTAGPVLAGHTGPVNAAAFSRDGATVYTASYDGTIVSWRRSDGARGRALVKVGWGVNVLVRLPGSDRLAFGTVNGTVAVLDPASGATVATLPAHNRPVLALATIAKPGLLATGAGDGTIRVLRIGDWSVLEEFRNPYGPIWALAFVDRGTALYYGSLDDFAMRWQIAPRKAFEPVASRFPRRFQASAEMSLGERQFARKCSVCHTLEEDGRHRAGPTLRGLFGRKAGTVPGYPYSDALRTIGLVWDAKTLASLLERGPDQFTPGSKMPLQIITDAAARDALVAYLRQAAGTVSAPGPGRAHDGVTK